MPKTSSRCLNSLLEDDGMKDSQLAARASIDEADKDKIVWALGKQHEVDFNIAIIDIQISTSSNAINTF